jgi:hypothetical protein
VLEHLDAPMLVMGEIYRICKSAGRIKVIAPYFRSEWAFVDPTHKTFFTVDSFSYYDPSHIICQRYDYVDTRFKVEKIVFNETLPISRIHWLKKIVIKIANRWPKRYEAYLSHLVPLDDITYYLKKI